MDIIGYIAGILSVITLAPQIIKLYKTKSTKDLSLLMMIIWCISVFLWMVYGICLSNIPMIITNALVFIMGLIIIFMIFKYKK